MGGRRDTGAENNACMCEAGGRDGGGWEANWPESGDGKAEGRGCEAGHGGRLSGLITIIIKSHCLREGWVLFLFDRNFGAAGNDGLLAAG